MTIGATLRLGAIAICVAGVADPVLMRDTPVRQRLTLAVMDSNALSAAERLRGLAGDGYEARIFLASQQRNVAACPSSGGCVIASSGAVPDRVTAGAAVIGAVLTTDPLQVIDSVDAPTRVHPAAAAVLQLRTRRPVQRVEIYDGEALVGFAEPAGKTEVDVTWVPLASGARLLRVRADADEVHIGVVVDATPAPLLFYEPETTWLGSFVRRALQEDARLSLRGVTRVAPSVMVAGDVAAPLRRASLDGAGVVFVAAPDALTTADVDLLERFVTHRGGSLVVIPDRPLTGPVLRLLPRMSESHRVAQPSTIGRLRAREHVFFEEGPGIAALERIEDRTIVAVKHLGRGRVIVSGALDAWRHRDAKGDFAAFWRSLAHDAAAAAGEPLRVTTARPVARPGDDVPIDVEWQTMATLPDTITAQGTFACGDERGPLRLWPGHRPATFVAVFQPPGVGLCRLDVSVEGVSSHLELLVVHAMRSGERVGERLEAAITAHGGQVVHAGQEDELAARIRRTLPRRQETQATRPMRSPLWLIPLVFCLAGEWWLRRSGAHGDPRKFMSGAPASMP